MSAFPPSLTFAVRSLQDRLAEEIRVLKVREVSSVTDYFVIATATAVPHIKALTDEVEIACRDKKIRCRRKGGSPESGWRILDYGDVVIHVMTRELREFYALEQLWSDANTLLPDEVLG